VVIQTSYLTPPMAPAIFYLRAVAPPAITYNQMFVGVIPYVVCQLLTLAMVAAMPWTATYLASTMKGF
jgi:TRAP-type mannitol/chloroaromatic compound transport system permease large subunit